MSTTLSPVDTPIHSPGPPPWTAPLRRKAREWKWRYAKNLGPSLKYRLQRGIHLSEEGRRIVAALDRDGFAVSSIAKLFGDNAHLEAMADFIRRREEEIKGQVDEARAAAGRVGPKKAFTLDLLGETPVLDPASPHARFSRSPTLLDVMHSYYRMEARLTWFNYWRTFLSDGIPRLSQYWHKDGGDFHMVTVFVYLEDVDRSTGPFWYACGSHPRGRFADARPDYFIEDQRTNERSTDEQMEKVVPRDQWAEATGERGTMIFADNRGYHKGGYATARERLLYACYYTSPGSRLPERFTRSRHAG